MDIRYCILCNKIGPSQSFVRMAASITKKTDVIVVDHSNDYFGIACERLLLPNHRHVNVVNERVWSCVWIMTMIRMLSGAGYVTNVIDPLVNLVTPQRG